MPGRFLPTLLSQRRLALLLLFSGALPCAASSHLYPDMFPYVDADAPSNFQTLQAWQLNGNEIRFNTLFANQGDGLFEIRRGPDIDANRHEVLQRVYLNNDFGSEFVDINIGSAPIAGTPGSPNPNDLNVIWFEDFTKFSLHEAPVVDGLITVGDEVASDVKTSWRLSANRGPLPGYPGNTPRYTGTDQTVEQRISVGWADLYSSGSNGQFVDITGVAFGPRYWLRQTVDPNDRIHETDETNNAFEILIDLNQPGEAIMFAGDFVQPGDPAPSAPGDLNEDGMVDLADWASFKAGATADLAGLDEADAYRLGDLNLDGEHTISDVVLFREFYDNANGIGAFASLERVPEPSAWLLTLAGAALLWTCRTRVRRYAPAAVVFCLLPLAVLSLGPVAAGASLFKEDFNSLPLGPNVNELTPGTNVWTSVPPDGWQIDNDDLPDGGVVEWRGWTFADRAWWANTAGGQGRTEFTKGTGAIAVADPDEWDDLPHDAGTYNTFLLLPPLSLAGVAPGSLQMRFDSSWRPEDFQAANLTVSYDGALATELLRWSSDSGDANYKPDATNETIVIPLNNPAGAAEVQIKFGMFEAGNDWWWAVDNLDVFTPTTLQINADTGEMTIVGAEDLAGYEIRGPAGSLDGTQWRTGNLDAQDLGAVVPLSGDLNQDHMVDGDDVAAWAGSFGLDEGGDLDDDNDTDGVDLLDLQRQIGTSLPAGGSWETLIADDDQLLEYYLLGSSTFASRSIGHGYNVAQGATNLSFVYSDSLGQEFDGAVNYVSTSNATSVPEPTTAVWSLLTAPAWGLIFSTRYRV